MSIPSSFEGFKFWTWINKHMKHMHVGFNQNVLFYLSFIYLFPELECDLVIYLVQRV